jgi:peptidoglycan hydrolase-like protein with peptidoglycan-binding domain
VDDRFSLRTREGVRKFQEDHGLPPTGVVNQATWSLLLSKSRTPTAAELTNTDIGPWFTSPEQHGYLRELQHRLRQLEHYEGPLSGTLDAPTRQAVQAFRASQGLSPSEVMDERAWARLIARTRLPSYKQLFDAPPRSEMTQELDPRCAEGKVVCISKAQKKMSLVVDGQVLFTREARFSRPGWESPTGVFRIWYMNQDTVSTIFGERTPMPYAIFYDGNVAIHYSDDFAQVGYEGGSHGCSQLRDYQAAKWLFEQVKRGDKVVVY